MLTLQTERLLMISLLPGQLWQLLEDTPRLENSLQVSISRDVITAAVQMAVRIKLSRMEQVDACYYPWYTYWLVIIRSSAFGAGLIGFKGAPSPQGMVEIGYGMDSRFQGQGYTTEGVRELAAWAFRHPGNCSAILANTEKSNLASQRVLEKAGFQRGQEKEGCIAWKLTLPALVAHRL